MKKVVIENKVACMQYTLLIYVLWVKKIVQIFGVMGCNNAGKFLNVKKKKMFKKEYSMVSNSGVILSNIQISKLAV